MIIYRRMEREDGQAVAALLRDCFSHPWKKEEVEESCFRDDHLALVAQKDDRIVGYIGCRSVLDEADITDVAVSPRLRQKGIGHQLLRELLTEARKRGITSLYLEVRASNKAAITLYEHGGFRVCGARKNYYSDPREDAWLMKYTENI